MKLKGINKENIKKGFANLKSALVVDKFNGVEWIALIFILLLIELTLFYSDNMGMFLDYFWFNEEFFRTGSLRFLGNNQLSYGIVQQLFCELWVLPINIIFRFVRFEPSCTADVIWFKTSMVFLFVFVVRKMQSIAKQLGVDADRVKWMTMLYASTVLVALPVFHIAQSDVIYTLLMLMGIEAYLKSDRKRFVLYFAMAVACKVIAIVVFIPLLLLMEKRIFVIARDTILAVIILPLQKVWYAIVDFLSSKITGHYSFAARIIEVETVDGEGIASVAEKTQDQINTDFMSHFYHKALYFEFPAIRKGYVASLLVVLFVLLCIWCYAKQKEDEKQWMYNSIYAVSVAWMIFFACASPSPYWIQVLYPTWFLLIFLKPEKLRLNLLLNLGFTLTMFLVYVVNTFWVYGGAMNLDYLLLKGILKEGHISTVDGPYVARYLNNFGIESFMNVITAVCLACAIALVAVNYFKNDIDEKLTSKEETLAMHGFAVFQIVFLYLWYAINVFAVSRW